MTGSRSILVVAAAPDDRLSTTTLRAVTGALAARSDASIEVWFLWAEHEVPWPGSRVVDELRTWWLNRLVDGLGLHRLAGRVRGLRLRWWYRRLMPDAILLDDGLGARLLSAAPGHPLVAIRRNPEPSPYRSYEAHVLDAAPLVLSEAPEPDDLPATSTWLHQPEGLLPADDVARILRRSEAARSRVRLRLGLPDGVPLVVGWGSDAWLDGSDLFVRVLWYLEDRHGIEAHGLWFDDEDDRDQAHRLRAEAERCGVADRFHVEGRPGGDDCWAGDAAFLPRRAPAEPIELLQAGAAGIGVVTFAPASVVGPWIHEVAVLDLEASAGALAAALGPADHRATYSGAVDAARWADGFLAVIAR